MNEFLPPSGGYGRIWECMYEGSMVGAGPEVFCLWPYVISKMRSRSQEGATVMLNPVLLKEVFGVTDEFVAKGIKKLCDVDLESKNGKEEDGRRLVHISGHLYGVVNGAHYIALRSKERHAAAQARYRKKFSGKQMRSRRSQAEVRAENESRERRASAAYDDGDSRRGDAIAAEGIAAGGVPIQQPGPEGIAPIGVGPEAVGGQS
jgi:hypothetical protein